MFKPVISHVIHHRYNPLIILLKEYKSTAVTIIVEFVTWLGYLLVNM